MKSFNIWKKIAAGILFLNIALTSFIGQPVAAEGTEGQPAIQRMGFSSKLSIGPGSQLFDGGSLSLLADTATVRCCPWSCSQRMALSSSLTAAGTVIPPIYSM